MARRRRILLTGILVGLVWLACPDLAVVCQSNADDAQLLEIGAVRHIQSGQVGKTEPTANGATAAINAAPARLKFVSYNMRWRGGKDLARLIETLRTDREIGGADVLALQEVDRNKKRTNGVNTARLIANALEMNYAWAAPPGAHPEKAGEEETGVLLLSRYPLSDITRIVLPEPGPGGRRRVALGATVMPTATTALRVYSVHAETRIDTDEKRRQLQAVLDDAQRFPQITRCFIAGDFNTAWGSAVSETRKLFTGAGYATPFEDNDKTWHTFVIKLKLDWMWLRGLTPVDYGIDRKVGFSDHYPLWLEAEIAG